MDATDTHYYIYTRANVRAHTVRFIPLFRTLPFLEYAGKESHRGYSAYR